MATEQEPSVAPSPDGFEKWPAESAPVLQERSFPLMALLQLATFWAVIVACIDGGALAKELDQFPRRQPLVAELIALAMMLGGVLGFAIGMGQVRMWRGAAAGAVVGVMYGLAIFAVYVAPAPPEQALGAAAVLMLTTIGFRIRSA